MALVKIINVTNPWIVSDNEETRCILDENYHWLEIYPDNKNYAITAMLNTENEVVEWYFDMTKFNGIENGIPYIMDFMLNAMFCDPVENPVPTKNRAKPKFLKELRHCDEI